ncbi:MAG TPA: PPK2 family polyphosphate kinase [Bryobacteraceae bacterium]|jgi:PPK2 family polyphosphate:nucleotide phosphotransferase|nr:PPK2 family polyphosphate kinase [Bryobacteraceae bacterium]
MSEDLFERYRVRGNSFRLDELDPGDKAGFDCEKACDVLNHNRDKIAELQNRLMAEKSQALLVILQAMDTGGKDPTIRDVLDRVNSQACRVTKFKKENDQDKRYDHLRRFHLAVPAKGEMGVFNRAYYDDLIRDHAHDEKSEAELAVPYRQINDFERLLDEERVRVIKIFLHISKEEQKRRLQERIEDPERHWELSESDFRERKFWDGYMRAYEHAIRTTNTEWAPWFAVPSDVRWFRDAAASEIIARALEELDPQYPPPKIDLSKVELD